MQKASENVEGYCSKIKIKTAYCCISLDFYNIEENVLLKSFALYAEHNNVAKICAFLITGLLTHSSESLTYVSLNYTANNRLD
jgi:hypothetical protein